MTDEEIKNVLKDKDEYIESDRMSNVVGELMQKYDKLKKAVGKIKATLEHDYIGECLYDRGIEHAIDVIDKYIEWLI